MSPLDKAFLIARVGDPDALMNHVAGLTDGQLEALRRYTDLLATVVHETMLRRV